jgi:hypothetical protein
MRDHHSSLTTYGLYQQQRISTGRLKMSARNLVVLVVGAGLAIGVAACDTNADTDAARATTTAAPATSATSAPATSATSAPATSATSAPTASPAASGAGAAKSACPVTEAELQATVKKKTGNGTSSKSSFTKIECYKNYAIATEQHRNSDEQYAVFEYASGSWSFLGSSSADVCDGGVPVDVIKHFRAARYGACLLPQ